MQEDIDSAETGEWLDALDAEHAETKAGSFYLKDGELYQFDGNTGLKVEARSRDNSKGMPAAAMAAAMAGKR